MPQLYQSADVFLHLAKEESFGNVFIEAMACGLPVIGHDTPRLRWILGDEGFLLDTENLAAVARQIELSGHPEANKRAGASRERQLFGQKLAKDIEPFFEASSNRMNLICDRGQLLNLDPRLPHDAVVLELTRQQPLDSTMG